MPLSNCHVVLGARYSGSAALITMKQQEIKHSYIADFALGVQFAAAAFDDEVNQRGN